MCLSCGCNKAHDQHGNASYVTYETLRAAAKADGITVNQVLKNINAAVVKDRTKHEDEYTEKVK